MCSEYRKRQIVRAISSGMTGKDEAYLNAINIYDEMIRSGGNADMKLVDKSVNVNPPSRCTRERFHCSNQLYRVGRRVS